MTAIIIRPGPITVLGGDPGLADPAYAFVTFDPKEDRLMLGLHGMCGTPSSMGQADRLRHILRVLVHVAKEGNPDYAGVEDYFIYARKKAKASGHTLDPNARRMLHVVGIFLASWAPYNVELINPATMVLAITGQKAETRDQRKADVQKAVSAYLDLDYLLTPQHIADAAGIAITRIFQTPEYRRSGSGLHAGSNSFFKELGL